MGGLANPSTRTIFRHLPKRDRRRAGSTGPSSLRADGTYGLDFPVITIGDMVRAQNVLLDRLKYRTCFMSLAGQWAACRFCNGRVHGDLCSRPFRRHGAPFSQNIAFTSWPTGNSGRPDWHGGNYVAEYRNAVVLSPRMARISPIWEAASTQIRAEPARP